MAFVLNDTYLKRYIKKCVTKMTEGSSEILKCLRHTSIRRHIFEKKNAVL